MSVWSERSYAGAVDKLSAQLGELVARHDKQRTIQDFSKYERDPIGFLREVLRCDPWSKQEQIAELVRDNARVCVRSANSIGKDWLAARLALWYVFARQGFAILSGPTERQVKHILMKEVRRAFSMAPSLPGELFQLALNVNNDVGILAFTSDAADRLTGYHHPRLFIALTEGQGVQDEAYEAALACATGPQSRILVCGNPLRPTGSFYRVSRSDNWVSVAIPASEHPNVVHGREEIPGAVTAEWVEAMAAEYGRESSIYKARVEAEFPTENIEGLIRRSWLNEAARKWESGELEGQARTEPITLALDPARYGPDKSVLAVVQGPIVRRLRVWGESSLTETADIVIQEANAAMQAGWRPPNIVVDAPGLGSGVVDILRKEGWKVLPYNGWGRSTRPRRLLNTRADSHWALRQLLQDGKVALPPDETLAEDLVAVTWFVNGSGLTQIESKDTLKKELGRSPDRGDSIVMGLSYSMGALRRGVGVVDFRI